MNTQRFCTLTSAILLFATTAVRAGTWTPLAHQPTFMNPPSQCAAYPNANCAPPGNPSAGGVLNANLLTDGSVFVEAVTIDDNSRGRRLEFRLIPDEFGSYVNGTWKQAASIPDARSFMNPTGWAPYGFASAVLPDGRVIYEGGEDNGALFALSSRGGIYDPVLDSWTSDWQAATNYPLLRITNRLTHHIFYSRTHDFSSMALANHHPATALFDVPANQEKGPSLLEVVTNGVASEPIEVLVR